MPALFIDKEILKKNIEITKELAGESQIIAIVKKNGYGLGLCPYAHLLTTCGIETLAVTDLNDAVTLRDSGIHCDILMLTPLYNKEDIITALHHYLIFCIPSYECGDLAEQAAMELNLYARAHICVDTGLGRYGFLDTCKNDIIYTIHRMKHICVTGIYSHFYASSCKNPRLTKNQFQRFTSLCDALENENEFVGCRHIAATCAMLRFPETRLDAVRIGSAFLGRLPFPDRWGYEPIGQLEASIENIRTLPAGRTVGYGNAFITTKKSTIAVVSAGYAHGLGIRRNNDCPGIFHLPGYIFRLIKNALRPQKIYASYAQETYPVLGRIGMNSLMIDITGANLSIGDTVYLPVNPLYVDSSIPRIYKRS